MTSQRFVDQAELILKKDLHIRNTQPKLKRINFETSANVFSY